MPLSGGLVGFVALRFYAEECAFSLSTQAQDQVRDRAEAQAIRLQAMLKEHRLAASKKLTDCRPHSPS